jgi:hypothetical protein
VLICLLRCFAFRTAHTIFFFSDNDNTSEKSDDSASSGDCPEYDSPSDLDDTSLRASLMEDPKQDRKGDGNALDAISNHFEILVQKKLGSHADDEFEAKLREARSRPYL